jgi:hypothetical protein
MSIPAAVAELNKEIAMLDKTITGAEKRKARLVGVRDSLLKEEGEVDSVPARRGRPPGRKPGPVKKSSVVKQAELAKKTVVAKKVAAPKKRVMSPEARKRIADAQKKRWAAQKSATTT